MALNAIASVLVTYTLFTGPAIAETYEQNIWSLNSFYPYRNGSLPLSDPASITGTFAIAPTIRNTCKPLVTTPFGQTWPPCPPFRRDSLSATLSCSSGNQAKEVWRTCQRWMNMPLGFEEIMPQQQAALKWRIRDVVEEEVTRLGLRSLQLEVVQVISWDTFIPR
jgi:hypothetical protein